MGTTNIAEMLTRLALMVAQGGPTPCDYTWVSETFLQLHAKATEPHHIATAYASTLRPECLHGHAYLKPHGYAGDFEVIDRIYTHWLSSDSELVRHDEYFQSQAAPMAVRNRKHFLKGLLLNLAERSTLRPAKVLNVGSGPARDVFEFFREWPGAPVVVHCVDIDPRAIDYASKLCAPYSNNIRFEQINALRLRLHETYDLIWSAGLFDYLNDQWFKTLASRYYGFLEPQGELVIGNFSSTNPTRPAMELLCEWYLEHRDADKLLQLATEFGVPRPLISIDQEIQGVNLFLRIRNE